MADKLRDFKAAKRYIEMIAAEDICAFVRDNGEAIEVGLRLCAMTEHPRQFALRCMVMNRPPYWFASGRRADGTVLNGEYATPLDALMALDEQP